MWKWKVAILGIMVVGLFAATPVIACPNCRDAVTNESDAEDEDQVRLARAYNHSIYLMVGVPYFLAGGLAIMVARKLRQRGAWDNLAFSDMSKPSQPTNDDRGNQGHAQDPAVG